MVLVRNDRKIDFQTQGVKQHNHKASRPVLAYPQLDKLSTAWKLSLPGPTNGLSSPVFKEVMAQHLCLPSPACASIVGQRVGAAGVVGPFGDEVMTATLPQDTWRTRGAPEERQAQWMASLRGPGWARRGRCHGF